MGVNGASRFKGSHLDGVVSVLHPCIGRVFLVDSEAYDIADQGVARFDATSFVCFDGILEPLVAVDFNSICFERFDCSVYNPVNLIKNDLIRFLMLLKGRDRFRFVGLLPIRPKKNIGELPRLDVQSNLTYRDQDQFIIKFILVDHG